MGAKGKRQIYQFKVGNINNIEVHLYQPMARLESDI